MQTYSVIIPAYNAESTIFKCISSVLSQTYKPLEVIVVDDHSLDNTREVVLAYKAQFDLLNIKLSYIHLDKNSGPSKARNIGLKISTGDYIAFLDSDDIWDFNKLHIVNHAIILYRPGLIFHRYSDKETTKEIQSFKSYEIKCFSIYQLLFHNPIQTSCAVLARSELKYFNESMKYSEDYDLWIRISEASKTFELIGPPLTFLSRPQLSRGGLSGNRLSMRIGEIKAYFNFCKQGNRYRFVLLPFLINYSLLKHLLKFIRIDIFGLVKN